VRSNWTSFNFLELLEFVSYFSRATAPVLFTVMKYRGSFMKSTWSFSVIFICEISSLASRICTYKLSIFHLRLLFWTSSFFLNLFLFLFLFNFIEFIRSHWFWCRFINSSLCSRHSWWFPKLCFFFDVTVLS